MKEGDFVIALLPINGVCKNSVGLVRGINGKMATVHFIGQDEVLVVKKGEVGTINVDKTGKGYSKKICNICHILKKNKQFRKKSNRY